MNHRHILRVPTEHSAALVCSALIVSQLLVFAFLEKKIRISKVESEM
jgi:hypothetical protein